MLSILRLASRMSEGFRVEIWAIKLLYEVRLSKHTQRIFTTHSEVSFRGTFHPKRGTQTTPKSKTYPYLCTPKSLFKCIEMDTWMHIGMKKKSLWINRLTLRTSLRSTTKPPIGSKTSLLPMQFWACCLLNCSPASNSTQIESVWFIHRTTSPAQI